MWLRNLRLKIARRINFEKFMLGKCGRHSIIFKPLMVNNAKKIYLDDYVTISEGARIEVIESRCGFKFDSYLKIGAHTSFEQFPHIISAGKIDIGHDCVFSSRVLITNIDHDYSTINKNVLLQPLLVKDVKIGNYCFFGMDSKIFPGVTIGDNVIVGANTIVTKDVPSYSVVVGCPARIIKKYNFEMEKWENVK